MVERDDIVEIGGVRLNRSASRRTLPSPRTPFLMVWFRCCHAYGRLYRNPAQTMYVGRCPRCGARVHAMIGPDGTTQRMFEAK